jgi:hypothetical protein
MSIQSNFPAIAPSLLLDFANTKQLDNRITFTRSTPAVYYDGKTTAMAEQNLTLQSQSIGNSPWSVEGVTFTTSSTAPDGTSTATAFTEQTNSGTHRTYQSQSYVSGSVYTISFYAKYVSRQYLQLNASGIKSGCRVIFDIQNGTVTDASTATTTSVNSVGNSWYRCVATITCDTSSNTFSAPIGGNSSSTGNGESYTGNGSLAFYLWGFQTEQRATATAYTATTTQPITNYIPVLLSAGGNQARFDCNPTTGESLGLLVEEQRTNLQTYSSQFDNGVWVNVASSITVNTVVAPDGTLLGDKLVENTASSTHSVYARPSITSGTTYALSFYVKPSGRNRVTIQQFNSSSAYAGATFDVSTGTVVTVSGTGASGSIVSVGNGWYRCVLIGLADATTSSYMQISLAQDSHATAGAETYTGNGFSGVFIWGSQFEAGSFATSYIATTSASATRAQDLASMTGVNFSSWYNNAEWTVYTEASFTNINSSALISIDDGSFNNISRVGSYINTLYTNVYSNSAFQFNQTPVNSITKDVFYKVGFAAKPNSYAAIANTNSLITQNSGILFTGAPYQMTIGNSWYGDPFTGRIKKIAYYPIRVSDTNLQALTS